MLANLSRVVLNSEVHEILEPPVVHPFQELLCYAFLLAQSEHDAGSQQARQVVLTVLENQIQNVVTPRWFTRF